jgi:60 kDa SS-A/Ro ribonucleoprotein
MKFNLLSKTKNCTVNHEGAQAYKLSPEMDLYTAVIPGA